MSVRLGMMGLSKGGLSSCLNGWGIMVLSSCIILSMQGSPERAHSYDTGKCGLF